MSQKFRGFPILKMAIAVILGVVLFQTIINWATAPDFTVEKYASKTSSSNKIITGLAPSDSIVTVNGKTAIIHNGRYKLKVNLRLGKNKFTVKYLKGDQTDSKTFTMERLTKAAFKKWLLAGVSDKPISDRSPSKKAEKRKYFPGLMAVDVYLNFKNKGFDCNTKYGSIQVRWRCTLKEGGVNYDIEAFGKDDSSLTTVRATAWTLTRNSTRASRDFIGYAASIPYKGSTPAAASNWARANTGKNLSRNFGTVKFRIVSKAKMRMLVIQPR